MSQFTPYSDSALQLGAPNFDLIDEGNYVRDVKDAIELARKRIEQIKNSDETPTFANTITAMDHASTELDTVLGVFYTLLSAESTDAMQQMAQEIGPITSEFSNDVSLDPIIFQKIDDLWSRRDSLNLNREESKVLENSWIGFVRNGAKLNDEDKDKLRDIDSQMSQLSPKFSDNSRQSANAFEMHITDKSELSGLPETAMQAAQETAESKNMDGWLFTLEFPSYIPFMTYADNRERREQVWRAFSCRAFNDQFDNQDNIKKIVTLRNKRAQLLGYNTHADYVLERRMAQNVNTVFDFIENLETHARPAVQRDLENLRNFARKQGFDEDLKPWDVAYWSEKLKKAEYDFDEEELRPYFPLDAVTKGAFDHAQKLFGVTLNEVTDLPVYADDVKTYEVKDADGSTRGLLYTDFHPRPSKRQGAWQATFRDRDLNKNGDVELPIVNIVMNFTKPTKDKPSLLSLDEVETLFHEFGHALHSLMTNINQGAISGTSVYWDFVELPSQLMENWLGESETLNLFAKHYETNEPIPSELIQKMQSARNFMKGWQLFRQLAFCTLDMAWHGHATPETIDDVLAFERQAMDEFSLIPYEDGCMSTSFGHLFAGGYSAGYYSYLWAQVLDADAFEAFLETSLYDVTTAQKFLKDVLSQGGVEHPMTLYKNFRGREPDPQALLRRDGLINEQSKAA
jgi:peptidyl-dipeptidase Dcp